MNDIVRKNIDKGAIFAGVMLIAVGTMFLLDRFGIADFHFLISRYWPLIIVGLGLSKVLHGNVWGGLWMVTIGGWLQISRLHLFGLTYGTSWPLLLIALGAGMVARTVYESAREKEKESHEA
jgi:hypothetical protein